MQFFNAVEKNVVKNLSRKLLVYIVTGSEAPTVARMEMNSNFMGHEIKSWEAHENDEIF